MEEYTKLVESLLEKATDFSKTSFELAKLKALDKTSDIVSSLIPHAVVIVLIVSLIFFLNVGLAFWLGAIMGKTFFGLFALAAFYCILEMVFHLLIHKKLKKGI